MDKKSHPKYRVDQSINKGIIIFVCIVFVVYFSPSSGQSMNLVFVRHVVEIRNKPLDFFYHDLPFKFLST